MECKFLCEIKKMAKKYIKTFLLIHEIKKTFLRFLLSLIPFALLLSASSPQTWWHNQQTPQWLFHICSI